MRRLPATRRRHRRTNREQTGSVLLKGVATLGSIALFVAFAVTVQEGVPTKDYSTMYIATPDTGSLRSNDRVAIGGVRVGRVVAVTPGTSGAKVELQLEPGVSLPRDTQVRVRANGLLGARYVQLIPGSDRSPLADGSTIKGGETTLSSTVPDALDVFNKETRGALGATVTGLGRGVLGNGEALNDGVRVASDATVPFEGIMNELLANGEPAELLPSLDSMMTALDGSRPDLTAMLRPAAAALEPFADRRASVEKLLETTPPALDATTAGLIRGTRLLTATRELADSARRTLPFAPEGLRQTTALLRDARTERNGTSPLERANALLKSAERAVPAALKVTSALKPLLPRLEETFGELSPILKHVGKHGCDVINSGIVLRSMTGFVGTGEGPNGPSSGFRLQAATGSEALGIKEQAQVRDAYYAPCSYLGREYQTATSVIAGRNR